jgi:hypothetical protein
MRTFYDWNLDRLLTRAEALMRVGWDVERPVWAHWSLRYAIRMRRET